MQKAASNPPILNCLSAAIAFRSHGAMRANLCCNLQQSCQPIQGLRPLSTITEYSHKRRSFLGSGMSTSAVARSAPVFSQRAMATTWLYDSAWLNSLTPKQVSRTDESRFQDRVRALSNVLLTTSWTDSMELMLNVPFWEAEFEVLHRKVRAMPGLLAVREIAESWMNLSLLLDFFFVCEDLRDHCNELATYLDHAAPRESGPHERIVNLDEHIKAVVERYERLKQKCPQFKTKLDESVGRGLQLLRQRVRFDWPGKTDAYY